MDRKRVFTRNGLLLAVVVVVGVVGPGLARGTLAEAGFDTLGSVVFATGYLGMALLVWYGWIRPLDITGPTER